MKRMFIIGFVVMVGAVNVFAQTNTTATAAQNQTTQPRVQPRSLPANANTDSNSFAGMPPILVQGTLSHASEAKPVNTSKFRHISAQNLFAPPMLSNGRNTWASVEDIFRPENDLAGDSLIRDTVVTIFPTGR